MIGFRLGSHVVDQRPAGIERADSRAARLYSGTLRAIASAENPDAQRGSHEQAVDEKQRWIIAGRRPLALPATVLFDQRHFHRWPVRLQRTRLFMPVSAGIRGKYLIVYFFVRELIQLLICRGCNASASTTLAVQIATNAVRCSIKSRGGRARQVRPASASSASVTVTQPPAATMPK